MQQKLHCIAAKIIIIIIIIIINLFLHPHKNDGKKKMENLRRMERLMLRAVVQSKTVV